MFHYAFLVQSNLCIETPSPRTFPWWWNSLVWNPCWCPTWRHPSSLSFHNCFRLCSQKSHRWTRTRVRFHFTITPWRSRCHHAVIQTDLDFSDDITLMSNNINQAQDLLNIVQAESKKIGLVLNSTKTKYIALNSSLNTRLNAEDDYKIEKVEDFKYL